MTKKEVLERKINDAADGLLSADEIRKLENELQDQPELLDVYKAIISLPDIKNLYPEQPKSDFFAQIERIENEIKQLKTENRTFEELSLAWFRNYALAASLVIFAMTSVYSVYQSGYVTAENEITPEEFVYPSEERVADEYVLYLQELTEQ